MLKVLPTLFPHFLGTANSARVDFYNKFQREADDYDRDFTKKYDEDLNTTLIFVCVFIFSSTFPVVLTICLLWGIGRFVFCSCICFYRRCRKLALTGLHTIQLHRPYRYGQYLARAPPSGPQFCSPSVERSRSDHRPRPIYPLFKSSRFSPLRLHRHVGQTVAQSLLPGRDAWICH